MDDRTILGDDDPELARFFAGEDFTGPPVEDGGKGLTFLDSEPVREAECGE